VLANKMKWYNLSIVAVVETHFAGEGEIPLDEEGRYSSRRQDCENVEGVGLVTTDMGCNASPSEYIT